MKFDKQKLLERLEGFRKLPKGWADQGEEIGSIPTTDDAYKISKIVLDLLNPDITLFCIFPIFDGGVFLEELRVQTQDDSELRTDITINPDGSITGEVFKNAD
jgi:hypothetical protein